MAIRGQIDETEFVKLDSQLEYQALKQLSKFYKEKWIPSQKRNPAKCHGSHWCVRLPHTYEKWFAEMPKEYQRTFTDAYEESVLLIRSRPYGDFARPNGAPLIKPAS